MSRAFKIIEERNIPELNSVARLYVHRRTGARLLSVITDDENKVFSINFRTIPKDSTGVAHILEHSVLNGSQKYLVKAPFVELLKGSLATFVNASTYPDKTLYPVASQNLQDFYNLIDVYVDAVLHPLLGQQTLMQEGWHYEINDPNDPLIFKGVVFNEMKGAYSSPDRVLSNHIGESLFPKHVYGVSSGGDPRHIPDLTYEDFKAFWEAYYHPSNSFIYFYGNDDPERRLRIMEEYLKPYKKKKVRAVVPLAKAFKRPKKVQAFYDAGADQYIEKKHYLTVNWKLPDTSDQVLNFSLRILGYILIGTPASPLRKAMLDSGLGEDLAGWGMASGLRHFVFSTGLKGTRARHAKKIEGLILDTLEKLARDGIDPDTIAASMNTIEFRLRENNSGSYPRGLFIMNRILTTWIYDEDPFKLFSFEAPLNEIKTRLAADPRYFEKLVQTHLSDNVHRTTLRLKPDPEAGRRFDEEEKARLAKIREALSVSQIEELIEQTRTLKLRQETPDSAEALESIPVLELKDLEKKVKTIPVDELQIQETKVLYHDLFTNGILYLNLGFDLRAMPKEYVPLSDVFARALVEMGTAKEDFVRLLQRIGKSTGGIYGSAVSMTTLKSRESRAFLMMSAKSTVSQSAEMMEILKDILLTAKFDDRERLKQIVLEEKSGLESSLAGAGTRFVNMRLRAQFGSAGWIHDQTKGIGYLFALRELANDIDKNWKKVLKKFEAVRAALINGRNLLCDVTLDDANWHNFRPQLEAFISALPAGEMTLKDFEIHQAVEREGLAIPAQVNFVGKGANLYDLGYELDGSSLVILGYLRMAYLWEKIRVQGGAYGALTQFDQSTGVFSFLSYRDPNVASTLENYDRAADFLKGLNDSCLSANELKKAIIASIGDLDAPQLPDAKGYTSMMRYLTGRTDEIRQKLRDEVLSTNGEDFVAFGKTLEKVRQSDAIVAMGSQSALEGANIGLKITQVL
jgi:Zn-dependent M16 (insulinase) family peptidase